MTIATAHRLRRLAAALAAGEALPAADAAWLADRLRAYLAGAADGLRLDDALGLALAPGATPWWEAERRAHRDQAIVALVSRFDGAPARRAELAADRLQRYAASAWRTDRRSTDMPCGYAGTIRGEMFAVLQLTDGDPPSARSIRRIASKHEVFFGHQMPVFVASGPTHADQQGEC